jgi:serine/threonine protein kinase
MRDAASQVAVKLMEPGAEFRKEALLMRQFRHPHVAEVYDYGVEANGLPWMVMEYLPGETLDEWSRQFPQGVPLPRLARLPAATGTVPSRRR